MSILIKPRYIVISQLLEKSGGICPLCKKILPVDDLEYYIKRKRLFYRGVLLPAKKTRNKINADIDHIIPTSKGGTDDIENLQLAHRNCNFRKGNKIIK